LFPDFCGYAEFAQDLNGMTKEQLLSYSLAMFSRESPMLQRYTNYEERRESVCELLEIDPDQALVNDAHIGKAATRVFIHEGEPDFLVWYSTVIAMQQMCEILRSELTDFGESEEGELGGEEGDLDIDKLLRKSVPLEKQWAIYDKKASLGSQVIRLRGDIRNLEKELFAGEKQSVKYAHKNAGSTLPGRKRVKSKTEAVESFNSSNPR